jgi:hypothetical protein
LERQDVGVRQAGDNLDLTKEPFRGHIRTDLRMQDLDRDLAVMLQVLGQKHRGHAPAADLRLDGVPVCKC